MFQSLSHWDFGTIFILAHDSVSHKQSNFETYFLNISTSRVHLKVIDYCVTYFQIFKWRSSITNQQSCNYFIVQVLLLRFSPELASDDIRLEDSVRAQV